MNKNKYSIEEELFKALYRYSFGRISIEEASSIAKIYAPKLEKDQNALKHKSIGYYAREIVATL